MAAKIAVRKYDFEKGVGSRISDEWQILETPARVEERCNDAANVSERVLCERVGFVPP